MLVGVVLLAIAGSGMAQDGAPSSDDMNANDRAYYMVHTKLAAKHIRLRNLDRAREELDLLLTQFPKHAKTHFRKAIVCAKLKDFTAAWRHLELARGELGGHPRFTEFEKKLADTSPKPANLSLETPREALPAPRFQAEAVGQVVVALCENREISSRIVRLECVKTPTGGDISLIGSGPVDPGPVGNAIKEISGAKVTIADTQPDPKRMLLNVLVSGLPATNPGVQAVNGSEFNKLRDEAANEADVSLRNHRETEPDAAGLMSGTYDFIARDPRAIYQFVGELSTHLAEFNFNRLAASEFNQQAVWRGELSWMVKIAP